MKTFCSYQDGVGVLLHDKKLLSDKDVKKQFGAGGCSWFVEALNKAADNADDDYCYVSEEYHAGEVLFMVITKDKNHFVVDAFDTPQEATDLKNNVNNIFTEWKNS